MRRGEALGLRDSTVDLDAVLVTVDLQGTTVGYEAVDKKVKSEAGNRTFALDSFTAAAWRAYLARRARWKLASGGSWPDTEWFFVQPDGEKWHPDTVSKRFDSLVRDAGLPPVRLHDLRHCAATYLKASGADLHRCQGTPRPLHHHHHQQHLHLRHRRTAGRAGQGGGRRRAGSPPPTHTGRLTDPTRRRHLPICDHTNPLTTPTCD